MPPATANTSMCDYDIHHTLYVPIVCVRIGCLVEPRFNRIYREIDIESYCINRCVDMRFAGIFPFMDICEWNVSRFVDTQHLCACDSSGIPLAPVQDNSNIFVGYYHRHATKEY